MEDYKEKSWFARNWGWVLGGGCLSIILIVVLAVGGIIYKVADAVAESEPYTYALAKTMENEKVIDFLGEPIETNGIGNTSFNYKNGTSTAELTIPIKGPKDEGSIIVNAEKINDEWAYNLLYVKIDGETERINLLESKKEDSLDDF
ncbi:cytochrome c oxidase assembly factor Coa1 family protein [Winogradskyella sp. PE311]|uniref:cytochrome c oxidase assembly factor Coa1 family protein n=1 Tax=Winogradskyella sp. PE311 TaxID=3366943 RepID=UPI00397F1A4B